MRINTNVASLNAQRILGQSNSAVAKSIGRLSSGFRINKAADDAAGLGIANQLRADIRSLKQAARNADQATSMLQIAEGAAQTIGSIVDRMKELATQAASDNVDTQGRESIKAEWDTLQSEIVRIVDTTKFQGGHLLKTVVGVQAQAASSWTAATAANLAEASGDAHTTSVNVVGGTFTGSASSLQVRLTGSVWEVDLGDGWNDLVSQGGGLYSYNGLTFAITHADSADTADDGTVFELQGVTAGSAGTIASGGPRSFLVSSSADYTGQDLVSLGTLDLTDAQLQLGTVSFTGNGGTAAEWRAALSSVDSAITHINSEVAKIGAAQNRIEFASANVRTTIENMSAAESTIRDADMAAEMAEFTRHQILQQAGTAMLAQANSAPQMVLRLLQ